MEIINSETMNEYESFVSAHEKGHFMQSVLWSKVKIDWKFHALVLRNDENIIIASVAVITRKTPYFNSNVAYAPRGPVLNMKDDALLEKLLQETIEFCKKQNCYTLIMDPDIKEYDSNYCKISSKMGFRAARDDNGFSAVQPKCVFRLDIKGKTEEEILNGFASKTRYNLRIAEKKGVRITLNDLSALDEFHRLMDVTGKRDHFQIRPKAYFENLLKSMGEHARLYMAYYEDKAIAGTLAIQYGNKTWYLYGASDNEYRNVMPNYLLQWQMIKWGIESKCEVYDFRGVSGDLSEANPLYGLYKFKKGFSGEFTEFVGEYRYVFKPFLNFTINFGIPVYKYMRRLLKK